MNKAKALSSLNNFITSFAQFYHEYRVKAEHLRSVKYRIVSSLDEFEKSNKIQLALTDKPGDLLPCMSVEQVKKTPDIISSMHPVDVNSINDLFYLTRDLITEVRVSGNTLSAISQTGVIISYDLSKDIDLSTIKSIRLSYMIGYIQAERLIREIYTENVRYKIIKDNISSLCVEDLKSGKTALKKPMDILFSNDYKKFSKDDVAKISYICGQMSNIK